MPVIAKGTQYVIENAPPAVIKAVGGADGIAARMIRKLDLDGHASEQNVLIPAQVAELMVDGRDVALIRPGRLVRLAFEVWPAIQFSGWSSVAHRMFDGQVRAVDPSVQPNGLFRVLVELAPDKPTWPDIAFISFGAKVRG
ncbi:hypothetical protein ACQKJ1_28390 [Methylorubrum rhodesianum]|uniref:hypothetical protein n=1 Tax=Methylorubrum rhodesianum TaxID=29427 RepID=UPI003D087AE8